MSAAETRQIRIIAGRLGSYTEEIVRRLAIEVSANLIEDTPVDTSWARSNWIPYIGSPVSIGGGNTGPSAVSTRAAQQQGAIASLAGYSLDRGSVFVSSGVPYILKLNAGHSNQAPAGYVQAAIRRAIIEVEAFNSRQ